MEINSKTKSHHFCKFLIEKKGPEVTVSQNLMINIVAIIEEEFLFTEEGTAIAIQAIKY